MKKFLMCLSALFLCLFIVADSAYAKDFGITWQDFITVWNKRKLDDVPLLDIKKSQNVGGNITIQAGKFFVTLVCENNKIKQLGIAQTLSDDSTAIMDALFAYAYAVGLLVDFNSEKTKYAFKDLGLFEMANRDDIGRYNRKLLLEIDNMNFGVIVQGKIIMFTLQYSTG
ncbi:MAG: hypothetical protein LBQ51_04740 [Desulfovibrio sp.]|jgi:hypothetical protein|nr:hypothetical protein [Desulfovibrio sp.]